MLVKPSFSFGRYKSVTKAVTNRPAFNQFCSLRPQNANFLFVKGFVTNKKLVNFFLSVVQYMNTNMNMNMNITME